MRASDQGGPPGTQPVCEKAALPAKAACSGLPTLSVLRPIRPNTAALCASAELGEHMCRGMFGNSGAEAEAALAAVQVLGNIAVGSAAQTQFVLDAGGLTLLRDLLASHRTGPLLAEACFAAANIAAGTRAQIQVSPGHIVLVKSY